MSKLEANINIKDFEEFKVSYDIFHKMLQDENINVSIRLKYMREFNNKIEKENNMNVPYVKVNNQKEFERVVAKMERETGLELEFSINDISFIDGFKIVGMSKSYETNCVSVWNKNYERYISDKIISADEYLTGTIENFTLSDLEDGMVVEYRNGEKRLLLNGSFLGIDSYAIITDFNEDLSHRLLKKSDIVKVYKVNSFDHSLISLPVISNLTLIFDAEAHRNKSKVSQRKYEIENEIKKLQEELNNL